MKDATFKEYVGLLRKNRCLLFMCITALVEIMRGFIMTQGISWGVKWISQGCLESDFALFMQGIIVFSVAICQGILVVFISEVVQSRKIINMGSQFRKQLIHSSMYSDINENKPKDELLYIFNNNINNVISLYQSMLSFLGCFGKIIGGYVAGFMMSWQLTLLFIVFGIIKLCVDKWVLSKLSRMVSEMQKQSVNIFANLSQIIEGISFFKLSANSQKNEKIFSAMLEDNKKLIKEDNKLSVRQSTIGSIIEIGMFLSLLILGFILTYLGSIEISILVAFVSMSDFFINPYNFISGFIKTYKRNIVGAQRVIEVVNTKKTEIRESTRKRDFGDSFKLEVKNLTFGYNKSNPVLKDINFSCKSGEVTYFVGRSGVGKSTLFNILSGINKADASDIYVINHQSERYILEPRDITYITQAPFLFNGSIVENITLTNEDNVDYARLTEAIQKAGMDEFIAELPDGFNYSIKDKGLNFSGGQKSRLALSRCFYNHTPVILLDEIYASLDDRSINIIEESIQWLCKKNICVLFITHRTDWLDDKMNIVDLDNLTPVNAH